MRPSRFILRKGRVDKVHSGQAWPFTVRDNQKNGMVNMMTGWTISFYPLKERGFDMEN